MCMTLPMPLTAHLQCTLCLEVLWGAGGDLLHVVLQGSAILLADVDLRHTQNTTPSKTKRRGQIKTMYNNKKKHRLGRKHSLKHYA